MFLHLFWYTFFSKNIFDVLPLHLIWHIADNNSFGDEIYPTSSVSMPFMRSWPWPGASNWWSRPRSGCWFSMSVMIINETHCRKIFVNRYFEAFHNIAIIFEKRLNKGITITTVKGSISTVCDYTSLYLVFSIPSKSSSYCCMSLLSQLNRIQKQFFTTK